MRDFGSNLGAEIPIASSNKYSGVMFPEEDFFREPYSWGIKFRADVFLGIFFQGRFIPLAMNSRAFFPTLIKKIAPLRSRKTPYLWHPYSKYLVLASFETTQLGFTRFLFFQNLHEWGLPLFLNILEKFSVKVYTFGILGIYFKECTVRFAV